MLCAHHQLSRRVNFQSPRSRLPANTEQGSESACQTSAPCPGLRPLDCLPGFADTHRRCDPSSRPGFRFSSRRHRLDGVIILRGRPGQLRRSRLYVPHTPLQRPPESQTEIHSLAAAVLPKQPATIRCLVIHGLPPPKPSVPSREPAVARGTLQQHARQRELPARIVPTSHTGPCLAPLRSRSSRPG